MKAAALHDDGDALERAAHELTLVPGRPGLAEPGPRQVVLAVGRERADAADLDADRTDVGEPAQREGGDGERYGVELPAERSEILVRDELVQHHALAQQAPDRSAVVPRHAHDPGDRPEDPAEHRLDALPEPRHVAVDPAERDV